MSEILCVICQKRRPQWPMCCEGCRRRMREQLAELVEQYALLDAEPGVSAGPKVSGTRTAPLPGRLDVLNLVGVGSRRVTDTGLDAAEYQIGETPPLLFLEQWVIDWIGHRQEGEHRPPCTVVELVKWLDFRLDAAADEHLAIDAFAAELAEQLATLRRVNGTGRHFDHLAAPCPTCGLVDLVREDGASYVECRTCRRLWTEDEYRRLCVVLAAEQGVAS